MKLGLLIATSLVGAVVVAALGIVAPTAAKADTFNLTSCHILTGCPAPGTVFGNVTLAQAGTSVNFSVALNNGSRFVETAVGGGELFLFNDALPGSAINGVDSSPSGPPAGGLVGFTNLPQGVFGAGTFTA